MHFLALRHGRGRMHFLDGMIGFVPLDDFESYSPPEHLRFEIRGMKLPRRCLANAKPAFSANLPECLISRQRLADAFIHLDEAVVGEPCIIHRASRLQKTRYIITASTLRPRF